MMKLFNLRSVVSMLLGLALLAADWSSLAVAKSDGERTVKGVVIDSDGFAVIGAGVTLPGTTLGVVTNENGEFSINLPSTAENLEFSCIGYATKKVVLGKSDHLKVVLQIEATALEEVAVVAYGVQKKETVTGAISSVGTKELLQSPNASVANALSGQITGVTTHQTSGQPGEEDPKIFVRGSGSLTDSDAQPLILVDGVEMGFFNMDPNEIENISVLKDASATAVFGVRGANGVILVTTKRGLEGKPKIQWSSSVGLTRPTRIQKTTDSYTTATLYNQLEMNDGLPESDVSFQPYALEAFKNHSNPIMFPDIDWFDTLMKDVSVQTQHNVNISGGTKRVKYFASVGYLFQDGLTKDLHLFDDNTSYQYHRYNYRANLDVDVTSTTNIRLSIGGNVGNKREPLSKSGDTSGAWHMLTMCVPFSSPGIIDGHVVKTDKMYWGSMIPWIGYEYFSMGGYRRGIKNTMNANIEITQDLDFITKGLKLSVKGAYNTYYTVSKKRSRSVETWTPYFKSSIDGSGLQYGAPGFDDTIVYRVFDKDSSPSYSESDSKDRDWYVEAALRYHRRFKQHNVGALLLYNQQKKYYPGGDYPQPAGYVGFVGRVTYDYKTKYMAEFNIGYNGSENFAPGKRYGTFPAFSVGWILTEEPWMKQQKVFNYLKIRATVGSVGSDKLGGNARFMYLPSLWNYGAKGYYFGTTANEPVKRATEGRMSNPDVTWEKAIKQNYAIEATFLRSRLKLTADYFREFRKDILTTRHTIPGVLAFNKDILPSQNIGKVRNHGFEVELKWHDKVGDFGYHITANTSFSRNKILFMDEVEPNEPYMKRTGRQTGLQFGYVFDRFYNKDDFNEDGSLKEELPDPGVTVYPGDVKFKNLNPEHDNKITPDDQTFIGKASRPDFIFGLNYGISYKGFELTMNWVGTTGRSVTFDKEFRHPFNTTGNRALGEHFVGKQWTPETAETATLPRFSKQSAEYNYQNSTLYVRDGSYLRLKTVRIGYTLNKGKFLKALGMSSLNVYLSGYNLLTIDGIKVIDPEGNPSNGLQYPITQTYNFGFVINF